MQSEKTNTFCENVVDLCTRVIDSSCKEWIQSAKKVYEKQKAFAVNPHELLYKLVKESENLKNKQDPSIYETVLYLETLWPQIHTDDTLQMNVKELHAKLSKGYTWYENAMKEKAYVGFFATKQASIPGFAQMFLRKVTFKTAFTNEVFTKYVNQYFHPKAKLLRATARLLNGLKPVAEPHKQRHLKNKKKHTLLRSGGYSDDDADGCADDDDGEEEARDEGAGEPEAVHGGVYDAERHLQMMTFMVKEAQTSFSNLKSSWTKLGVRLSCVDLQGLQKNGYINALQACEKAFNKWSEFSYIVKNSKPYVNPPAISMEESVLKTVHLLVADWEALLDTSPTKGDIKRKWDQQFEEMKQIIDDKCCSDLPHSNEDVTDLEVLREKWIQKVVIEELLAKGTQALAEVNAPVTYSMFEEQLLLTDSYIAEIQRGCTGLSVDCSKLQRVMLEAKHLPPLPAFDREQHKNVHNKWESSVDKAIRMDTAFYMLSLLESFDTLKVNGGGFPEQKKFIQEQKRITSISPSMRKMTVAMETCMTQISEEGTKRLQENFDRTLIPLCAAIIDECLRVHTLMKQKAEREHEEKKDEITSVILETLKACLDTTSQIHVSLRVMNMDSVLKELNQHWSTLTNQAQRYLSVYDTDAGDNDKYEKRKLFLFHLKNIIQKCDAALKAITVNKVCSFGDILSVASMLLCARHVITIIEVYDKHPASTT